MNAPSAVVPRDQERPSSARHLKTQKHIDYTFILSSEAQKSTFFAVQA
jgi:hypothetical protein